MPEPLKEQPVAVGDMLAGKYRVEKVLGIGGMGVVVAARHVDLDELRAIKFMRPEARAGKQAEERFMREARASAKLRSEHIVHVYDIGRLEGGEPYLVMEHLDGADLKQLMKRYGTPSIEQSVDYILQAAEGLAEAHASGIIHRDLKPSNLFVTAGNDGRPCVKVLDFGISKLTGSLAEAAGMDLTQTTAVLGSPLYMSPEQMSGNKDLDARSDIWSLGIVLYQLLVGHRPFSGKTITAVTMAVATSEVTPPSVHRPEVPPELDAVLLRCLEKDCDDRYPNVVQLARALEDFASPNSAGLPARIERVHQLSSPVVVPQPRPSLEGMADHSGPYGVSEDEASEAATEISSSGSRPQQVVGALSGPVAQLVEHGQPAHISEPAPLSASLGTEASWGGTRDPIEIPVAKRPGLKWVLGTMGACVLVIVAWLVQRPGQHDENEPSTAAPAETAAAAETAAPVPPPAEAESNADADETSGAEPEPSASTVPSATVAPKIRAAPVRRPPAPRPQRRRPVPKPAPKKDAFGESWR